VNCHASMLSKSEAEKISSDDVLRGRVLKSFELMLDFWGMKLEGDVITRTQDWEERYDNWNGGHNNLRVCRTLKSLGQLGLPQYKKPFVTFLTQEIIDGRLKGCSSSLVSFWIPTLSKSDQKEMLELYHSKRESLPKKQKWVHSDKCIEEESGQSQSTVSVKTDKNTDDEIEVSDQFERTPTVAQKDLF